MKHKRLAVTAAVCVAVMAVGGICMGAGIAMGGSPEFYYDSEGIHVKENTSVPVRSDHVLESTKTGTVKRMDISLEDADLRIVSGREWAVEYVLSGSRKEPVYSLDGQTLTLKEGGWDQSNRNMVFSIGLGSWQNEWESCQYPYVKITVPEGAQLEEVQIFNRYGKVDIDQKLLAQKLEIEAENGDVCLDGWQGDDLKLELLYGTLTAGSLEGKQMDISNEQGNITLDSLEKGSAVIDMEYGELEVGLQKAAALEAENENGSVRLNLDGTPDEYGVSLHTEYGTIRTPRGVVEQCPEEYDSAFIRLHDGNAQIRVESEYGDIQIRER